MPATESFSIVVLAGPNGAGKTSIAREALSATLGITEFVNADTIASGLSAFGPDRAAFAAGRVMLARVRELAAARETFAFESTLASRTFAPWLRGLVDAGVGVHVVYVWLRTPDLAISRVRARVRKGGHSVPDEVIRRRYYRSAANFWNLYRPLAVEWRVYDNSGRMPIPLASGTRCEPPRVADPTKLAHFMEVVNAAATDPEENDHGDLP